MFQALLNTIQKESGCVMEQIVDEKYIFIFGYLNGLGFQRLH